MNRLHSIRGTGIAASVVLATAACSTSPADAPEPTWTCSPRVELSSLWKHLSDRYDADQDGQILAAEYGRGEVRFANYDRNEDGVLEASDFPEDTHFNGFSHMLLRSADADEDQQITPEEWRTYCSDFDVDGDGRIAREEVEATMGSWTDDWRLFLLSFDQDSDGDFDDQDLKVAFKDQDYNGDGVLAGKELSGWQRTVERPEKEAPSAGEPAPEFTLGFAGEPNRTFSLAAQRAGSGSGRPTALLFGSYT